MGMASRPIVTTALLGLALCGIVGCSPLPAALPDGVRVSVHQNRPDTEDRRLQVRITNETDTPLTITALTFSSPRFAEPSPYRKAPTTIRAGGVVDLPVALGTPVCEPVEGTAAVHLDFERADGASGRVSVVPGDPLGQLEGISEQDCLNDAIADIADIRGPDALRTELVDGRLVAMIDLTVVPTGAGGSFTIASIDDTVLFELFQRGSPAAITTLPLGLEVRGDGDPQTVTIPLVPARCDPHAVAEDKRGTLLPLRVEVSGLSGISYFAVSDALKGALYSYVHEACTQR